MYLHICDNEIISSENIVGIFSYKQLLKSKENVINYKKMNEANKINRPSKRGTKCVIILKNGEYVESSISVSTLTKRLGIYKKIQGGMNNDK